ncbi:MAG: mRNA surveillance protein pelota [Candidatus Diapherotrites archaeon]
MRILNIDEKQGIISFIPESEDDLWHLSKVIEKGDLLIGETSRKEKSKEGTSAVRKIFTAEIEVEDFCFDSFGKSLRVNGRIFGGNLENIPLDSMQVIEIVLNQKYKLVKKKLRRYHLERLIKASKVKREPITIVVIDDENATIAITRDFKCEIKAEIRSGKSGKRFESEENTREYLGEVAKKLIDMNPKTIVIAGPGFVKDELFKFLEEKKYSGKIYVQGTSTTGITGVNEVLKSKAFENISRDSQIAEEFRLIEELLEKIARGKLATYGFDQVKSACEAGAVEKLFVLDKLLEEKKEDTYQIMELAEGCGAKVHVFNYENEPGQKLKSLGGLAAILRYDFFGSFDN